MCSVISRVRAVQRALALTPRLRTNTEASSYSAAQNRRVCPGLSAGEDPLRAFSRSYCSRMALTEGLLFRQVRLIINRIFFFVLVKFSAPHSELAEMLVKYYFAPNVQEVSELGGVSR